MEMTGACTASEPGCLRITIAGVGRAVIQPVGDEHSRVVDGERIHDVAVSGVYIYGRHARLLGCSFDRQTYSEHFSSSTPKFRTLPDTQIHTQLTGQTGRFRRVGCPRHPVLFCRPKTTPSVRPPRSSTGPRSQSAFSFITASLTNTQSPKTEIRTGRSKRCAATPSSAASYATTPSTRASRRRSRPDAPSRPTARKTGAPTTAMGLGSIDSRAWCMGMSRATCARRRCWKSVRRLLVTVLVPGKAVVVSA